MPYYTQAGEAIAKYFEALKAGICPICGKQIEEKKQVGRCVYALPCYHRLYQSQVKLKDRNNWRKRSN